MRRIENPRQTRLIDPFDSVMHPRAKERLLKEWPGVFRRVILELMPAKEVGERFHPYMGRPTKELYSAAGLVFIMEFMNWTEEEAVNAYMHSTDIQWALNLDGPAQTMSRRTIQRYRRIFVEDELAAGIMERVTERLIAELELDVSKQRLDSTHVFSDMARFGRTRMMGVAVKRFLTQVKRHDPSAYESLPVELRKRYEPGAHRLFGETGKDAESRRLLRQQVAQDLYDLVERFGADESWIGRTTYQCLARILLEQCEVAEGAVEVKAKTGASVMRNTSDPDAGYDGHKGPGYHVQLAESCVEDNEVQLFTCAIPQSACASDSGSLPEVLDKLEKAGVLPDELFADTHYGGDANVEKAAAVGVELVSPTSGNAAPDKAGSSASPAAAAESPVTSTVESAATASDCDPLSIDDFNIDEATETVVCCPAGHAPESSVHDAKTGTTTTVMPESACGTCEYAGECPAKKVRGRYVVAHTAKARRLDARRREERTDVFRERYAIRGGIESANGGLKRRLGLGRLRVRGKARVFNAILLKIAGWNIFRAAAAPRMRRKITEWARKAA